MRQSLLLVSALLFSFLGCTSARSSAPMGEVRPGVDVLRDEVPNALKGKRVGLITNHTGTDRSGTSTIDVLTAHPEVNLVALYAPEHGIRGVAAPGEHIASGVDEKTGLPIHSLYGETEKPTPQSLEGVDALVFDIQDIGTRQYTYISTMALAMQAAAEKGIPFVVLDRPNPIGGTHVEGNILDPRFSSFVGIYPIPVRHGMTTGELAQLFNREFEIGANLTVVPVEGWTRDMWFDETGLPWVNPSPNIRSLEAAIHYPGTVFFEATNLSEGRGTELPFHQTGAPWLRAEEVVRAMSAMDLPGVRFEAVQFPVEAGARKFPGQTIPGVRLILTDRESYQPVKTSLLLIDAIRRLHPSEFEWRGANTREPHMMTLARHGGTDRLLRAFEEGTLQEFLVEWDRDAERFRQIRQPYLLYQ
jgi:uncharacterized protein YbbC (DUF1343 family)